MHDFDIDEDGDMTAKWTNGTTLYVCPLAAQYEITEITAAEAEAEAKENHKPVPRKKNVDSGGPIAIIRLGGDEGTFDATY